LWEDGFGDWSGGRELLSAVENCYVVCKSDEIFSGAEGASKSDMKR